MNSIYKKTMHAKTLQIKMDTTVDLFVLVLQKFIIILDIFKTVTHFARVFNRTIHYSSRENLDACNSPIFTILRVMRLC